MNFGDTWPVGRQSGGPAITPPTSTRPTADRKLGLMIAWLDARDAHRTLAPELGCPDCSAGPGEWCDPWCGRFRDDPGE